jgi:predicted anti-sigma-YlaC factor YlaD
MHAEKELPLRRDLPRVAVMAKRVDRANMHVATILFACVRVVAIRFSGASGPGIMVGVTGRLVPT